MLPIVIWIMRDQFASIPVELEEAALVDGLSIWGAFVTIVSADCAAGHGGGVYPVLVLTWNEYFFAALLTSTDAKTLPVMVASQTGSQGINWWSMAALVDGGYLAADRDRDASGTVYHQGDGGRSGEVAARLLRLRQAAISKPITAIPRGIIQKPRMGRKPSTPPTISSTPAPLRQPGGMRAARRMARLRRR